MPTPTGGSSSAASSRGSRGWARHSSPRPWSARAPRPACSWPTSATPARTCCAPARCASSPRTTRSPPSSCAWAGSRRTRARSTRVATCSPARSAWTATSSPTSSRSSRQPGDRLLLCSDGLSNELDDDEILALLRVGEPSDAARALVAAANAHGGLDNITAVVADVDLDDDAAEGTSRRCRCRRGGRRRRCGVPGRRPAPDRPRPHRRPRRCGDLDGPRGRLDGRRALPATGLVTAVRGQPLGGRPPGPHRPRAPAPAARGPTRAPRVQQVGELPRRRCSSSPSSRCSSAGYVVLRWYGTSNYVVDDPRAPRRHPPGPARRVPVVAAEGGRRRPLRPPPGAAQSGRPAFRAGVQEPTLERRQHYVANWHCQWQRTTGHTCRRPRPRRRSTTTTLLSTTGGT